MQVHEFLDAIRFFGEPDIRNGVEKSLILAPYVQELSKYEGDILADAFALMMKRRNFRNFPLLAECLTYCGEVQKSQDQLNRSDAPIITTSNRKSAQALVLENYDLAYRAAEEGWIHGLWDFCRVNQRAPEGEEIGICYNDSFEEKRARLKTPNPEADKREERLTKLVLGTERRGRAVAA